LAEDTRELANIIEASILAAEEPLTVATIMSLFPDDAAPSREEVEAALQALDTACVGRGIELKRIGKGYRFQSREKYSPWLRKLNEGRPPRYSRALMETLAIVAYRQPVTRGDIEEIRGVTVSSDIMRVLLNRGWVKEVGHRDVPGHPALFGTTRGFLEYFNLRGLSELPPLIERREQSEIASELNLSLPLDPVQDTDGADDGTGTVTAPAEPGDATPVTAEVIPLEPRTETATDPNIDRKTP
jgi:segregation and condensation protein B